MGDLTQKRCVACSIFKKEMEQLTEEGKVAIPVHYIDSMMHMNPEKLEVVLDKSIAKDKEDDVETIILYGECHNHMDKYTKESGTIAIPASNCVEIFLGKAEFKRLLRDGAFFLLPEWTHRWKEVFQKELDLKGETAKEFMQEMNSYFLYVDTGVVPIPTKELDEMSETLGLPWKIKQIELNNLLHFVTEAIER